MGGTETPRPAETNRFGSEEKLYQDSGAAAGSWLEVGV